MKHRKYTAEFKQSAIDLVVQQNYTLQEAAESLGVSGSTLAYWVRIYRQRKGVTTNIEGLDLRKQVAELQRENQRLKLERDILKKAAAFFAKEQL